MSQHLILCILENVETTVQKDWPILMGGKHLCFPVKLLSSTFPYSSYKISLLEERIVNLYSYTQLTTFYRCNSSYLVLTLQTNNMRDDRKASFINIKDTSSEFCVHSRVFQEYQRKHGQFLCWIQNPVHWKVLFVF